jgi:hypothetical protein
MEIFKLVGNIFVDNEKANKNIESTDKKGFSLGKTFQKMGKSALKFGKLLGGAALAGGAAIIALGKKTGDAADRLLDLNSITGMSTDEIQKWEKVATVAGVSADAMTNVSQKLTKQMDILSTGTGKAAESAEKLGLSYEDLEKLSPDERMNALVAALQDVKDPAERAKLGTDLLGGAWKDLAPILDVGADKLKDVKDNANIISNDDLNQANEFRIKMDQMKEKAIEFGMDIAVKLMPFLNKLFDWIGNNMPMIEKVFTNVFTAMGIAIDAVVAFTRDHLIPIFMKLKDWFVENWPLIKEIAINAFKTMIEWATKFWSWFNDNIIPILESLWELWKAVFPSIQSILSVAFDTIVTAATALWEFFDKFILPIIQKVFDIVADLIPKLAPFFEAAFGVIGDVIEGIIGTISGFISIVGDAIDAVKEFFATEASFKQESRGEGRKPDRTSGKRGLAAGGTITKAGDVRVGEIGPEILSLPEGARVTPLSKMPDDKVVEQKTEIKNEFNISELVVREDADIDKIARALFNLQVSTERGFG